MAVQWQRWLRYAKARLDSSVKQGEATLDRREAEQEARAAEKPWLSSAGDGPSFDEVKARIAHDSEEGEKARPSHSAGDPVVPRPAAEGGDPIESFDMAAQQKAADERLAAMRKELGLDDDASDHPYEPPKPT